MATTIIESFFQRSLEDMVKGLRVQMIGEVAYLSKVLDEIRKEIKSMDHNTKAVALQKLTYLNMLQGTDMGWAAFHVVEVMSMQQFSFKKIGYLAASQSFDKGTDVLLLITNLLRKDFGGKNEYESSLAIECLSRVATLDLARDLTPELFTMLASSRPFVRKKATVALLRVFTQFPDAIRVAFKRMIESLGDRDPSVVTAVVSVLCDLAVKDPKPYLPLAPELYKLLVSSPNNWLCIKLVKILGLLAPLEPRLGRKIAEPLCELMRKSEAKSLLLECIQTVTLGLTEHRGAITLCVEKLNELMAEDDTNLKYLCLRTLANLMPVHHWAIAENKEVIVRCVNHRDPSIQKGALRLIIGMVTESNVMETVHILLQYAYTTDKVSSNELVSVILSTCSSGHYALISDFSWYVSVLAEMARISHCECGDEIGRQLIDVAFRVKSATCEVLRAARDLLLDPALLDRVSIHGVLSAAAWIAGEYVSLSYNFYELVEALLQPRTTLLPPSVRALYLQAVFKIFVYSAAKFLGKESLSISSSADGGSFHSKNSSPEQELSTIEDICVKSPRKLTPEDVRGISAGISSSRSSVVFGGESEFIGETFTELSSSKSCWADASTIEHNQVKQRQVDEAANDWQDESVKKYAEDSARIAEGDVQEVGVISNEQGDMIASLGPTIELMEGIVTALVTSSDVEVQERACNILGLLQIIKDMPSFPCHNQRDSPQVLNFRDLLDALHGVLTVELGPVSVHAQERVNVVAGLVLENLDALGPMHNNQESVEGLIRREGLREWEDGNFISSHFKDGISLEDESASLLAQHRQRHQKFYLPTEGKSVSSSSGYPRPAVTQLYPGEVPSTPSTPSDPVGDDSLVSTKPHRLKARPVVVKLDDEDDHLQSSTKAKKKDLKDQFISKTIMNVLAGSAHSVHKDEVSPQGLKGWDSGRTRQSRSRVDRLNRHSGKFTSIDQEISSKFENAVSFQRADSLAVEGELKSSNVGKRLEHVRSVSRHRQIGHEKTALLSNAGGEEPQSGKSLRSSSGKARPRRPGGYKHRSLVKEPIDANPGLDFPV